jgi:hypothetical protein
MADRATQDALSIEARRQFASLVESVGVKRFAQGVGLSTRQVNRTLSAAQPNPIERLIRCLQCGEAEVGDRVLDFVCQEMGGHFVREEAIDEATVNAVRECAEAIAAISDGQISEFDVREIREAISALAGLVMSIRSVRDRRAR